MNGRRMFFAGAKIKKNYVSFYLPALYMFPDLADRISPVAKEDNAGAGLLQLHHLQTRTGLRSWAD